MDEDVFIDNLLGELNQYIARVASVSQLAFDGWSGPTKETAEEEEEKETARDEENNPFIHAVKLFDGDQRRQFGDLLGRVGDDFMERSKTLDESGRRFLSMSGSYDVRVDEEVAKAFEQALNAYTQKIREREKDKTLLRALMVAAVSDFETYLGSISHHIISLRPELVQLKELKFTLKDLLSLRNLESAAGYVAEAKVDELLSGEIETWTRWFEAAGVDLEALDFCDSLHEIYARRHIAVHTDLRVNKRFQERLRRRDASRRLPAIGETLGINRNYLHATLIALHVSAVQLCCFVLEKQTSGALTPQQINLVLVSLSILPVKQSRRRTLEKLASGAILPGLDSSTRLTCWVELQVLRRELGERDQVVLEASQWDVSALSYYWGHVKAILAEESDAAEKTNQQLVAGSLEARELKHPLYRGLRELLQLPSAPT